MPGMSFTLRWSSVVPSLKFEVPEVASATLSADHEQSRAMRTGDRAIQHLPTHVRRSFLPSAASSVASCAKCGAIRLAAAQRCRLLASTAAHARDAWIIPTPAGIKCPVVQRQACACIQ